jgi:hypothetical protein
MTQTLYAHMNNKKKRMLYLYTMDFYSATTKYAGKWMELENIILSEVSQAQKTKTSMFSHICRL